MQPLGEAEILFQQGEKALADEAFDQAQSIFIAYLGQYPQGRNAADAWQLIGEIYARRGEDGPAQAFYLKAIELFPQSPAANRARLGLVDLRAKANRIAEAIEMCLALLATDPGMDVRIEAWQRLVHLYQITGDSSGTVLYAFLLYKNVAAPQNQAWFSLLTEEIKRLDVQSIASVWDRMDDPQVRSHLMYHYATVQAEQHRYADALEVFKAFRSAFPDHPSGPEAARSIQALTARLVFEPYTVGCLLPLSGAYEIYGRRALNAIEMALSLAQVGEAATPVRLVVKDSASEDLAAVQGVRALAQARVGVIIGPIATASAAAEEAQRLNIPIVTFTQKPEITQIGDFVFRHFISPQQQVRALVGYFRHQLALRNFAIMYPREAYGTTFLNLFWHEVVKQGARVVGAEGYEPQQTDFATTIQKLVGSHFEVPADLRAKPVIKIESNPYYHRPAGAGNHLADVLPDPVTRLTGLFFQDPDQDRARGPAMGRVTPEDTKVSNVDFDVLFIPDGPKMAALILPQLAYHDVENVYLAGTNLWHSQQLLDTTRQYAQNAVMVDGFFKESESSIVRGFVDTYRDIYGLEPGLVEAFAFDTANLIIGLMADNRIQLRHELRDAMKGLHAPQGVTGATAFAHDGEAIKQLCLLRVKGDKFMEIERP